MNEMKPEDVMRALECCVNGSCADCPYDEIGTYSQCITAVMKNALSLLREKDAIIAELTQTIAEKDAEICVKKKLLDKCEERFAEKDAEIERLEKEVERRAHIIESYALQYGTARDKEYFSDKVRVETINEFGRRLKAHECLPEYPWNEPFVLTRDIDQIAKEMKGDQR